MSDYDVDMILGDPAAGGILFNSRDADGTDWSCTLDDGWLGSPAPTTQFTQRSGDHGSTSGRGYLASRVVTLSGMVQARTDALLFAAQSRLKRALSLEPTTFAVDTHGVMLTSYCRRSGSITTDPAGRRGITWSATLTADDPRLYQVASVLVPRGQALTLNNYGDIEAHWTAKLTGPGGHVHINNTTPDDGKGGGALWFDDAYAIPGGASTYLDSRDRFVYDDTGANVSTHLATRQWFTISPGRNRIRLDSNVAGAVLLLTSGSAWL